MSAWLLLIPILLPIIGGFIARFFEKKSTARKIFSLFVVCLTSSFVIWFTFTVSPEVETIIKFGKYFSFALKLDGTGKIFSMMVALLWPFALLYSFAYMEDERRQDVYNSYYIMTFGIVLGIAYSANLMSMYVIYEALTFITLPLITHTATKEARRAGRMYLYYSLTGSSVALVGMGMLVINAGTLDFVPHGSTTDAMQLAYALLFFGFGVKAAIFPLCHWLPAASAAPTPTTALLHAVAVVKAGAFAIIRTTYYCFDINKLQGSVVQGIALGFAAFTIVYGALKAAKEQHFKRRLAYSTIANLSYILFGVALMTKAGLIAALIHLVYHSITKIGLFFACGAIIKNSGAHYVYELDGMGKKMPITFTFFTLSALSLTGIPLFACFVSKWYLCTAAIELNSFVGYMGMAALIISSLFTAIYALSIPIRAFVYKPNVISQPIVEKAKEPGILYLVTIGVFAILAVVFGVMSTPLVDAITSAVGGLV